MTRRLLAIAWEFPGHSSQRGSALSRRIGQVVRGFAAAGWDVDVLHRVPEDGSDPSPRALDWTVERSPVGTIRRLAVPGPGIDAPDGQAAPIRMIATALHANRHGDRSGRWARIALRELERHPPAEPPDLIIAFYSPRGPLALARQLHERWGTPWIADLQDESLHGTSRQSAGITARWMRAALSSAYAVVQVSPEWARAEEVILDRPVEALRHAIPARATPAARSPRKRSSAEAREAFTILYAGSLNAGFQDPAPFLDGLATLLADPRSAHASSVQVKVASSRELFDRLTRLAPPPARERLHPLGWLAPTDLAREMDNANLLVLIPWSDPGRKVVPSKLYEYLAHDRPILIAGDDSGACRALLAEWEHPDVIARTSDDVASALSRLLAGDTSGVLIPSAVRGRALTEEGLARHYLRLAESSLAAPRG
jgi:hypothetical protein